MPEKPKVLATKLIATSRLFTIEQMHLRFSNGQEREFERLKSRFHGAVMIVPLLDNDTILLVREYAAGVDDYTLGFPKGLMHEGEDILLAANRELMEEVGYGAKKLDYLTSMMAMPGYMKNTMKVVLARDLYPAKLEGDEPEELEVVPWHISELATLLARDDFCEARSIAAIFLVRELLAKS